MIVSGGRSVTPNRVFLGNPVARKAAGITALGLRPSKHDKTAIRPKVSATGIEVHDFFAEAGEGTASTPARVDVTIKRRAGRKSTTTISGLEDDLNLDLICRSLRRRLKCSGALRDVPTTKEEDAPKQAIVLTGDQRLAVRAFLLEEEICPGHAIHIRGA